MIEHKRKLLTCVVAAVLSVYGAGASAVTKGAGGSNSEVVEIKSAVWTEELGEVSLDQYTHAELAQMVDDYWTDERIRNATPLESLMPDCSAKALQEHEICAAAAEAYSKEEFWTAERVQKATAVRLPMPDGSVRRALIANEEEPLAEVSLPAALPLAAQAR